MAGARSLRYRLGDGSQLDVACDGEISTRHLSFIETGRATPSRDMILRLTRSYPALAVDRHWTLVAANASLGPLLEGLDPSLLDELSTYPATNAHSGARRAARDYAGVVVPLELVTPMGTLAFFGTVTVFGTPLDVTLSELAVEAFFPADAATAAHLRALPRTDAV